MQALTQASAVGFGTRRWTGTKEQVRTLDLALDRGCSLVDVSAGADAEAAVGQVLSRRLDVVSVVALTRGYDPTAVTARVRMAAGRLRRDRVEVLLFEEPERLLTPGTTVAEAERSLQQAFETCEALVDHGELRWYGVSSGRLAPTSSASEPFGLDRLLALARSVRSDHRFGVLQVPCDVLTGTTSTSAPRGALVRQARRDGLATLGTRPLPVWPASGAAPLATCQTFLLEGVDHVLVDPSCEDQVRAVAPMLASFIPRMRRAS